jgi:hypothetical protein
MLRYWKTVRVLLLAGWLLVLWWGGHWSAERFAAAAARWRPAPPAPFSLDELRHPARGCYLGVYMPFVPQEMRLLESLERRVGRGFTMISLYQAWGGRREQQFDPTPLNRILEHGAVPVLTWEPWVTDFEGHGLPPMPDRQFRNLQAIARGDYDFYLRRWARDARRWGRPLMIRLGHEMNATWYPWGERAYGNTAEDYVAMWRHVVNVFRQEGANNVLWIWSIAQRPFHGLYPGGMWVDWVGVTVLNFGTVPPGWRWRSFPELFRPFYRELVLLNKPIMIAEVGSAEEGGDKAAWVREAMLSLKTEFSAVRSFMWFNNAQDIYWPINWSLTSSPDVVQAFRRAAADPYFIAPPR